MSEKTILVTGGSGFIGSNLVRMLRQDEAFRVINLDKLTYAANPETLADLKNDDGYIFVQGDIGNRELVRWIFKQYHPVGVLNLAAESHVDRSIESPEDFVQTNIVAAYRLLDEALFYWRTLPDVEKKEFRFLHVSTDEVFGALGDDGFFTEETRYSPNSPYSASKAASDHFVRAYQHTYGLPTLITNCSNNYGPYQFPEKLIPMMIFNALRGELLPVYGDGSNVRDWIYVEDHCRAIMSVFEKGQVGETYVIGANSEQKNIDLVHTICNIMNELLPLDKNPGLNAKKINNYEDLIHFVTDRPGHDQRYAIDAKKMHNELGWEPEMSLEEGLRQTVRWYIENLDWVNQASGGKFDDWVNKNYAWRGAY
ncbi:MAG: dTDP-glucose 4,6-dehydratase [Anaerolineae bacterium]|jgi:dTDP-glucose 4,6-dehydratase|nr:dTDP-glucose 4,6-dehydratase [Candidatus Jacksonbacteria bacterium]MBT7070412.1 dTDP-glucose 4,6-dehydratase [Anaerolineae bacterium]MBT7601152.1 dTDP-glucose 4,6-dehydratase [Anaerolineae bacterium]MBT7990603.1 dTDP-glucose 4,6-dehydratase [Anaerolineae bacterium]